MKFPSRSHKPLRLAYDSNKPLWLAYDSLRLASWLAAAYSVLLANRPD